jgi:hypothetical protein
MKKVLVLLTLVAAVSAYSQGTIVFNNRVLTATPPIQVPISYANGAGGLAGPVTAGVLPDNTVNVNASGFGGINAKAALYGGAVGTAEADLVLLLNGAGTIGAVGFRSGTLAGFVNVGTDSTRVLKAANGGAPLGQGVFQVRAWDVGIAGVNTWADAMGHSVGYFGTSTLLTIGPLGGGSPPATPPNLVGLASFSMAFVPEPSVIGLGILGAIAGLMVFRRRS